MEHTGPAYPNPSTSRPCDYCPTWDFINDPATREGEKAIRRDQRRLDLRELVATAKDLRWTLDELQKPDLRDSRRVDLTDRLYRLVGHLATTAERKADAA